MQPLSCFVKAAGEGLILAGCFASCAAAASSGWERLGCFPTVTVSVRLSSPVPLSPGKRVSITWVTQPLHLTEHQ